MSMCCVAACLFIFAHVFKSTALSLRHISVGHHVTIRINAAVVKEIKQSPIGAVQV